MRVTYQSGSNAGTNEGAVATAVEIAPELVDDCENQVEAVALGSGSKTGVDTLTELPLACKLIETLT